MAILAGLWSLSACATLYQDKTQFVYVSSSPAFATVSVNGQPKGSTPKFLTLERAKKNQVIRIESPGYDPVEVRVKQRPAFMPYLMDVVLGVGVGVLYEYGASFRNDERTPSFKVSVPIGIGIPVLIDLAGGKAQRLSPKELKVTLTRTKGPPRVETIFIDPDDIQNIRQTRVRSS